MKPPVEETVQKWADWDLPGKVKYLLKQDELHTKAIDKLIRQLQAHLESHQAVAEARNRELRP